MQTFSRPQAEAKTGTLHVALLDGAGAVLLHEELPAAAAPHRRYMLCLQAELDVRDKAEDRKPSGATGVWTGATLVGTNTLRHLTVEGDIDEAGPWDFQPYAEKPAWKGWGRMQTVMVEDHI